MSTNFGDKRNTNGFDKRPSDAKSTGGAPKGKRVSTVLKELLETDISLFSDKLQGMDTRQALATELFAIVFHKDAEVKDKMSAIKEILDRTEGKAMQEVKTEVTTKIEPLQFKVIK